MTLQIFFTCLVVIASAKFELRGADFRNLSKWQRFNAFCAGLAFYVCPASALFYIWVELPGLLTSKI